MTRPPASQRRAFGILATTCLAWGSASAAEIAAAGSDTMRDLVLGLAEGFRGVYPDFALRYDADGSSAGPVRLAAGGASLVAMSRPMTADERAEVLASSGIEPVRVTIGLDALAVYVHRDNPVRGLSMQQLDAIFSSGRRCSRGWFADRDPIDDWHAISYSDLGAIVPVGRNVNSGSHAYFRSVALCGGEFRDTVREMPDSAAVIEAVAEDPAAIGYAGIGFRDERVRVLALSPTSTFSEAPYYSYLVDRHASSDDLEKRYGWVVTGKYPLSRELYVYLTVGEEPRIDPAVREFLAFALSPEGQAIVHQAGFIPLTHAMVQRQRKVIGRVR